MLKKIIIILLLCFYTAPTLSADIGNQYANISVHTKIPDALISGPLSDNYIDHSLVKHITSDQSDFTDIRPVFFNALFSREYEMQSPVSFYLRAGLFYNGNWYPVFFNGKRDVFVDKNFGKVIADPIDGLKLKSGSEFWLSVRRVAKDGDKIKPFHWNYTVTVSGVSESANGTGRDISKDFTMGKGLPFLADLGRIKVSESGELQTSTVSIGGMNYNGAYSAIISPSYDKKGIPIGHGGQGYIKSTAGKITDIIITNSGKGYDPNNPPYVYLGGGSKGPIYFSQRGAYSASAILGKPEKTVHSVLLIGDSYIASGSPSPDLLTNVYEYFLGHYSPHSIAINGAKASGYQKIENSEKIKFLDQLIEWGYKPTYCLNALGINDFADNDNSFAKVLNNIANINKAMRKRGMKIINMTLPPRTISINSWKTVINQIPYNSNYEEKGSVIKYNKTLQDKQGINWDILIDLNEFWRHPKKQTSWNTLKTENETLPLTSDGIHMNLLLSRYIKLNKAPLVLPKIEND